jgi:hypothetical protein
MKALGIDAVAVFLGLSCLSCAPQYAGGTSSSENAKLSGMISDTAGAPVAGTRVLLIPSSFNPGRDQLSANAKGDTTDADGEYSFDDVAPGSYNIEAAHPTRGTSLLITGISLAKKDSVTVLPDTLRKPGTVVVSLSGTADSLGGVVYIPGTTRMKTVPPGAQSVALDSVPQGVIPSILLDKTGGSAPAVLGQSVNVPQSDTAYVSNFAKIFINTAAAGANITTPVFHFPLLVRLDSTFTFGLAKSDGGDLRFAKPDGTPLRFQIAQWDSAGRSAAIWVSVDTVYPDSSTQYITLSWGNPVLSSASSGPAVFDTAFGFTGVWHLDDPATALGTANAFADATPRKAHATNFIAATDQSGIVGLGHNFNGTDYILVSKQILSTASDDFSIALWVNLRRGNCTIFSKDTAIGQDSCARRLYCGNAPGDSGGLHPSFGGKGCGTAVSAAALTPNAWHHVAFSWNAATSSASFYVDGAQTALAVDGLSASCQDNPRDRIIFGYDDQFLFGYLDELSISRAVRTADWIRLSYESQRADQKTVTVIR